MRFASGLPRDEFFFFSALSASSAIFLTTSKLYQFAKSPLAVQPLPA
jgi:hypothetical protein